MSVFNKKHIFASENQDKSKTNRKTKEKILLIYDDDGQSEKIYDLQGRQVSNPTRGIYIVGGRKVIIK